VTGWWFSADIFATSTKKTDCHDLAEKKFNESGVEHK
jgi:hypothetical protein